MSALYVICRDCAVPLDDGGCCADCEPWSLANTTTGGADDVAEEFVQSGCSAVKGLRNTIWAAGTIAVWYYLLWQFRGFIYNCFILWFGR